MLTSSNGDTKVYYQSCRFKVIAIRGDVFLFPLIFLLYITRFAKHTDIVIENVSKFPLVIPLIIAKLLRKPFIAVIHHIHGKTLFRELPLVPATVFFLYEILFLKIYAIANAPVITVSNASRIEICKFGFRKIYVVYPGVPSGEYPLRYSKASKPLLIYVGRVKRYKQIDHFVKACRYVVDEVPEAMCLVVGKGDKHVEKTLRYIASRLGIDDKMKIYIAEVSDGLKYKVMSMGWLYVFTSMKEGFGLSVLEALYHGTPVVAYDIPPLREIIRGSNGGYLVKKGDIRDLARVCINLIRDRNRILMLSSKTIEKAKNFDFNRSSDVFYSIIKIIVTDSGRRGCKLSE